MDSITATIGRMDVERTRWRVVVETWPVQRRYQGRLVFQPESTTQIDARASGPLLSGSTPEEVVIAAHDLPEKQVRALLRSLT